jgi:hypothetical protein
VISATGPLPQTFAPGIHLFQLQAPERAGGGLVTVFFAAGFAPGAWWAGPDPSRFPPSSDGDGRAVDVTDWSRFETRPAWPPDGRGFFGPDSFAFVPSRRRPVDDDFARRTFYEIFGDRIYARSEGDAVHQDSWVVLVNGGYDRDSPYEPAVSPLDPSLPPGFASSPDRYAVLIEQGLIGSPTAFSANVVTRLPSGQLLIPAFSVPYPSFDPSSVFFAPRVFHYWRASVPGKAYAVAIAVDAHHQRLPASPAELVALTDLVDAGGGSPADRDRRRQVLTFHVRPTSTGEAAMDADPGAPGGNARARR